MSFTFIIKNNKYMSKQNVITQIDNIIKDLNISADELTAYMSDYFSTHQLEGFLDHLKTETGIDSESEKE